MSFKKHQFTVTRQNQWPDGTLCVEISQGGEDYSNPCMMGVKYPKLGEGETFDGLSPAVTAGIAVYKAWQADDPNAEIFIAVGNTGGDTMPFDGDILTPEVEAALNKKATEFDAKLEHCAQCGEVMEHTKFGWYGDDNDCCSQECAEKHYSVEDFDQEEDED